MMSADGAGEVLAVLVLGLDLDPAVKTVGDDPALFRLEAHQQHLRQLGGCARRLNLPADLLGRHIGQDSAQDRQVLLHQLRVRGVLAEQLPHGKGDDGRRRQAGEDRVGAEIAHDLIGRKNRQKPLGEAFDKFIIRERGKNLVAAWGCPPGRQFQAGLLQVQFHLGLFVGLLFVVSGQTLGELPHVVGVQRAAAVRGEAFLGLLG